MKQEQDKNKKQPDENIQKNAYALGNAKVSNNDPDGITREERTRQYGKSDSELNKPDDRDEESVNYRQDV